MRFRPRSAVLSVFTILAIAACGGSDDTSPSGGGGSGSGGSGGGGGTSASSSWSDGSGGGGQGQGGGGGEGGSAPQTGPIVAPSEIWTWVDFNNAFCANGKPTGIGVNLTDKSKDVVIYFQGGGACWDQLTCDNYPVAHIDANGYTKSTFIGEMGQLDVPFFSRTGDGVLKDANYVFVPYCTGDVHAGNNVMEYGAKTLHHVGGANFQSYLERLVETFPDASRVLVTGSSAGGYGAGINYWRVREAFPEAQVDMLDDSGPPLPKPYLSGDLQAKWMSAWNLGDALPPGCTDCTTDLDKIFNYYGTVYTDSRFALLSYTKDQVISFFLGVSQSTMPEALAALATADIDPHDNMKYFYVTGTNHTFLGGNLSQTTNSVTLATWLTQFWTGDPAWSSQKP